MFLPGLVPAAGTVKIFPSESVSADISAPVPLNMVFLPGMVPAAGVL